MASLPKPNEGNITLLMESHEADLICDMFMSALQCKGSMVGRTEAADGIAYSLSYPKPDRNYRHRGMKQADLDLYAVVTFWPLNNHSITVRVEKMGYEFDPPIKHSIEKNYVYSHVLNRICRMYAEVKWAAIQARVIASSEGSTQDIPDSSVSPTPDQSCNNIS